MNTNRFDLVESLGFRHYSTLVSGNTHIKINDTSVYYSNEWLLPL